MASEFDNPKRWQPLPQSPNDLDGSYSSGVLNAAFLEHIAKISIEWAFLEEHMIDVLDWLLFTYEERQLLKERSRGHSMARQIFRSVGTHNYRVKLMKNLLTNYIGNVKRDAIFDEIIDEFASLGGARNDYAHGLWWTHQRGRVFIQTQSLHEFAHWSARREVTRDEIIAFLERCKALHRKIEEIPFRELPESITGPPPPWMKIPRKLPSESSP